MKDIFTSSDELIEELKSLEKKLEILRDEREKILVSAWYIDQKEKDSKLEELFMKVTRIISRINNIKSILRKGRLEVFKAWSDEEVMKIAQIINMTKDSTKTDKKSNSYADLKNLLKEHQLLNIKIIKQIKKIEEVLK